MQTVTCDNCGKTLPSSSSDDDTFWWIKVGWFDQTPEDACSEGCARKLITKMQAHRHSVEKEVAKQFENMEMHGHP